MTKLIKMIISLLFPALMGFILILVSSMLILKTSVPENMTLLFSIIAFCLVSIASTVLNIFMYKSKGIYIAIFSFIIMLLYKIISTIIVKGNIQLTGQGIIGILFIMLFCFIGCIVGSNAKK